MRIRRLKSIAAPAAAPPVVDPHRYPADVEKGRLQRDLGERFGSPRAAGNSREPTATAGTHGGSDVGQDESSGCETIEADPTRFPER